MERVCIIDYGLGNITSVYNAVKSAGASHVFVSNTYSDIKRATHLILPGVGSFSSGIKMLKDLDLIDILSDEVMLRKKPVLGICLGMQLLASFGNENGRRQGLGWIEGEVYRMNDKLEGGKIPHMGWNDVSSTDNSILANGVSEELVFYFVHSYHFVPTDQSIVTGVCDYAGGFAAMVECENIFATQFHPEKSHNVGLELIRNFLRQGRC